MLKNKEEIKKSKKPRTLWMRKKKLANHAFRGEMRQMQNYFFSFAQIEKIVVQISLRI